MSLWTPWRLRWRVWAPALLFFVLNLGLLSMYRLVYAGRVDVLGERLRRQAADEHRLEDVRHEFEARIDRLRHNREGMRTLYDEQFASERVRLTRTIAEFKELARRAGLEPTTISYPEQRWTEYGLVKKALAFGVNGSYSGLRQLVNLLEVSPTFLTLEQVSLAEGAANAPSLQIKMAVSTLFAAEPGDASPPRSVPGKAAPTPGAPTPPATPGASPAAKRLAEEAGR